MLPSAAFDLQNSFTLCPLKSPNRPGRNSHAQSDDSQPLSHTSFDSTVRLPIRIYVGVFTCLVLYPKRIPNRDTLLGCLPPITLVSADVEGQCHFVDIEDTERRAGRKARQHQVVAKLLS